MRQEVSFFEPFLAPAAPGFLEDAVRRGRLGSGNHYGRRCEAHLARATGAHQVLLTASGTAALEACALLLDLRPGDEVVVPAFAFAATASAFARQGAVLRFADVDDGPVPNVSPASVKRCIGPRTRAIVVLHYAGFACEMEDVLDVAANAAAAVIEDNALGFLGSYRGRSLGTIGDLGSISFNQTKHVQCGEGGGLVVNAAPLAERAMITVDRGVNRRDFEAGEVERYTWIAPGSHLRPSELQAAVLAANLEQAEALLARRRDLFKTYERGLRTWADKWEVALPPIDRIEDAACSDYYVILPPALHRGEVLRRLAGAGIDARWHYAPLHESPMGRRHGAAACPEAGRVARSLLRLPLHHALTVGQQDRVIDVLSSVAPDDGATG